MVWSARDALVLKMLTLILHHHLPCHTTCSHIKGHGGSKQSVQRTHDRITSKRYPFVVRTDIKGYYANINKHQLLNQLAPYIPNRIILNLLSQYLCYSIEKGGTFHTPRKGISRGCALSPLIAGFQLYCIDNYFAKQKKCRYQRYMDDFLILCPTRWHCRRAVKMLNHYFNHFGFTQHPDKTYIGKTSHGFDWLGYQFNHQGVLSVSPRSLDNARTKLHLLYEQASCKQTHPKPQQVVDYIKRWMQWACSGLSHTITTRLRDSLALYQPL